MDLRDAAHFARAKVRAGSVENDCPGATAVVITAGANQKPGQSRMELLTANRAMLAGLVPRIARSAPDTIIVVVTNPVDPLTYEAARLSGFPAERIIGSGTILDSTRFRHELGRYFDVNPLNVHALIVGEHGDSQLPVWSLASISGMRLADYAAQAGITFDDEAKEECFKNTRQAAYAIIERKGKTNFGVASVVVSIMKPIIMDSNEVLTVSRVGKYGGIENVALSMPCRINRQGAHHGVPLLLTEEEEMALFKSALCINEAIMYSSQ
jgi:L-lactate dehydrogenase